jgi:O-antigen ligase
MLFSPFLLSVAMWGLVFTGLWDAGVEAVKGQEVSGVTVWRRALRLAFARYFRQPALVVLSLLLLAPALSYFWSLDSSYWWVRTRVRLPFFVLPFAFANLPRFSSRQLYLLLYILVWTMVAFCIGVWINYSLDYENIQEGLAQGHSIPVPRHHIRFNLILVTAILSGGWLWWQRFVWRWPEERRYLGYAVLFLFYFLHVLSVRSGMAALYMALIYTALRFIWRTRRWKTGIAVLLFMTTLPFLALKVLPSLQTKIQYTLHDWQQYRQGLGDDYSDAERWISLDIGLRLFRSTPWVGVGAGDLPMEVQKIANDHFDHYTIEPKLPHNQFIYILAGTGILGLLLSFIAWFAPIFEGNNRGFYLFSAFQFVVFVSFLVEYTLETSIGVSFYLFYLLWFRAIAIFGKKVDLQSVNQQNSP